MRIIGKLVEPKIIETIDYVGEKIAFSKEATIELPKVNPNELKEGMEVLVKIAIEGISRAGGIINDGKHFSKEQIVAILPEETKEPEKSCGNCKNKCIDDWGICSDWKPIPEQPKEEKIDWDKLYFNSPYKDENEAFERLVNIVRKHIEGE